MAMRMIGILFTICVFCIFSEGCPVAATEGQSSGSAYVWNKVVDKATFPQGYNYPVFVFGSWMVAMNSGAWLSTDGKKWIKTELPDIGLNPGYQKYIQFKGAVYALGAMKGNYLDMKLSSRISRTSDFRSWETVAERSNLPARVFYGAAVFGGKIWLVGGFDGHRYYNDVWSSTDAVNWTRVTDRAAWSERNTKIVVFNNRLWLLGGDVIDGETDPNSNADKEIWSSRNGIEWTRVETNSPGKWAGTPVVFDDKLWLIGANRNDGDFSNALWVTSDGVKWAQRSAPWTPRGGVAVWAFDGRLYMTGGKYSETVGGEIRFIYSNDVWAMSRKRDK